MSEIDESPEPVREETPTASEPRPSEESPAEAEAPPEGEAIAVPAEAEAPPEGEAIAAPAEAEAPPEGEALAAPAEVGALSAVPPGPPPMRILEALLFTANEPLPPDRLKALAGIADAREIRSHIETLNEEYSSRGSAFTVEEVAGGYRMFTRPEYAEHVAGLARRDAEARLSPAALETLAIVAYRQPVLRAEVEKIRGVDAGGALKTLLDRGLVKVVGRAEEPGNPILYGTTRRFLEIFGLKSTADLPQKKDVG